jgi:murein tripeptide amidase MpaA
MTKKTAQKNAKQPNIRSDQFYRYAELTKLLKQLAQANPHLVSVSSIGKSYEGRDIWLATLTNSATGPANEKPAMWVDGNIHSIEVSASAACLHFLKTLCEGYGSDADITRALDTRAFYVCPRVNPDGAEWALADVPKYVRSSTRSYPFEQERIEGYEVGDVDGDGKILRIRMQDPNGHWKAHPDDARLLIRRDPAESGGKYYRVIPEGKFVDPEHFDGTRITVNRAAQGLDLNRNFPENWRGEGQQLGAGDYPTSEPEVKALVDFFIRNRNITGAVSFHTFSGVLLRPFGSRPDIDMTPEDLWAYKAIGQKGADTTGYPAISVYEEFRYHPKDVITGTSDWMFEHLGIYTWVVEIWSPMREAGIEKYAYIDWFRDHPIEHDLKMLKWSDEKLDGKGYQSWRKFKHPQFGDVEIGGWDTFSCISNVPSALLEAEVAKFPKWLVWQALISPKLEVRKATATKVGDSSDGGLYKVRLEVQNTGWLPTNVSAQSLKNKVVDDLTAQISLPKSVTLHSTSGNTGASYGALPRVNLGQLTGWNHKHTGVSFWPDPSPTSEIAVAEWLVSGKAGSKVEVIAIHPRAGTVRVKVVLK